MVCLKDDHEAEKRWGTCQMSCSVMWLYLWVFPWDVLALVIFLAFLSGSIFANF